MIKIRSTQKLATSTIEGLCDVSRQMISYNEDLEKGMVTIIVKDQLFQEKEIDVDGDLIIERKIIEDRIAKPFKYKSEVIDFMFSNYGQTISKTKSYTEQQNVNKSTILLAQTISASERGWLGMNEWINDTEHNIVNKFSE